MNLTNTTTTIFPNVLPHAFPIAFPAWPKTLPIGMCQVSSVNMTA